MKSLSVSTLITAAFACLMLTACDSSEEDIVPQMTIKKPAKTAEAGAPAGDEPELVAIQSLSAKKGKNVKGKTEKVQLPPGSVKPEEDGQYVIQVSIQSSKKAADAIVQKLAAQDIEAYVAEVENPGELEGTFYRVRIGYFSTIQRAQAYGQDVLAQLNFAWWVDNSNNDEVGKPSSDDNATEAAKPAPQPAAQPAPAAAAPAPAARPAAQPAPATAPAPAPAAKPAAQPAPANAAAAPAPAAKPAAQPAPAAAPAPAARPAAQPAPAAAPAPAAKPVAQPAPAAAPAPAAKPAAQPAPAAAPAPAAKPAAQPAPAAAPAAKPAAQPAPAAAPAPAAKPAAQPAAQPAAKPAADVVDDWE